MVYFRTKNSNLGKFLKGSEWKMKIYFMAISILLRPSGVFYVHLKYSVVIWYFLPLWYVVGTKENLATLLSATVVMLCSR
jgi:hypothetical protein